jgi:hypothetical protein
MLYLLVTFEVDFNLQSVRMGLHMRRFEVDIPHGFALKVRAYISAPLLN